MRKSARTSGSGLPIECPNISGTVTSPPGFLKGIEEVGEQLAAHFPYDSTADVDELTNDVDFE